MTATTQDIFKAIRFEPYLKWDWASGRDSHLSHRLHFSDQKTYWANAEEAVVLGPNQGSQDSETFVILPENHPPQAPTGKLLKVGSITESLVRDEKPKKLFSEDHFYLFSDLFPHNITWQMANDRNFDVFHRLIYCNQPGPWVPFKQAAFIHSPLCPRTYIILTDHYEKTGIEEQLLEIDSIIDGTEIS